MKEKIIASEAVFGFAAWLTCRDESLTIGTVHDAGVVAELAGKWCRENHLIPPRDGIYPGNIVQPKVSA